MKPIAIQRVPASFGKLAARQTAERLRSARARASRPSWKLPFRRRCRLEPIDVVEPLPVSEVRGNVPATHRQIDAAPPRALAPAAEIRPDIRRVISSPWVSPGSAAISTVCVGRYYARSMRSSRGVRTACARSGSFSSGKTSGGEKIDVFEAGRTASPEAPRRSPASPDKQRPERPVRRGPCASAR